MTTAAVATTNNGTQHHTTISSEHHQYDRLLCLLLLSFVNPLFIIMSKPVTTFWRMAGLSYLQYVNKAASTIRGALKEPAKSRLAVQDTFSFKKSSWSGGVQGPKTEVTRM
uniref:Uncharacterized protein n=1 Tax=Amphora coffeiformis TaxID=265554 RepID=A0A7S3L8J2_9STRA